jgi:signal transduction histidine kinase
MDSLDLAALLRDLVDLYEPVAEEDGLTLASRVTDGPLELRGNPQLLSRALVNLIENAIKYTPAPGRIEVSAAADGEAAHLVIADTGPGVPAEARERVFDRFYRLEQSRTTPGNGLGLSLVRAVIRLHGGTIRLEDNQPGLKAVVTLPLLRPAKSLPAPAAPAAIAAD